MSRNNYAKSMWFPHANIVQSGWLILDHLSGHQSDRFLALCAQLLGHAWPVYGRGSQTEAAHFLPKLTAVTAQLLFIHD